MAQRLLPPLTSPDTFGLFVSLLARYAIDAPDKTEFEQSFESVVGDDARKRALASRLVENFKRIPITRRVRELRDLAEPTVTAFSQARFEQAFKSIPTAAVATIALGDDVAPEPLRPISPFELITISFSGIYCADDTGDQGGFFGASDEPYVITNTVEIIDGKNVQRDELHPLGLTSYSSVDPGDFRVGPLAAVWHGRPTTVSLVCTVMEHDFGDPDRFKDEIALVVAAALAAGQLLLAPGVLLTALLAAVAKVIVEAINWLIDTDDDVIETVIQVIEVDDLRRMALNSPRLFVGEREKVILTFPFQTEIVRDTTEILHHFATQHSGGGGKYNVAFRVKKSNPLVAGPVGGVLAPP